MPFFFSFIFISWRLITLQYCSGFCHTLTWISHGFTFIPHPDPPSRFPLHPIPLGLPSAPGPSTWSRSPAQAGCMRQVLGPRECLREQGGPSQPSRTHGHWLPSLGFLPTSFSSSCSSMACRKALRSWLEDFWSNMPAWITFWSTFSLYLAAARIFSSTLLTVQSLSTRTSFCWPMRWARSCACRSCWREPHAWGPVHRGERPRRPPKRGPGKRYLTHLC